MSFFHVKSKIHFIQGVNILLNKYLTAESLQGFVISGGKKQHKPWDAPPCVSCVGKGFVTQGEPPTPVAHPLGRFGP